MWCRRGENNVFNKNSEPLKYLYLCPNLKCRCVSHGWKPRQNRVTFPSKRKDTVIQERWNYSHPVEKLSFHKASEERTSYLISHRCRSWPCNSLFSLPIHADVAGKGTNKVEHSNSNKIAFPLCPSSDPPTYAKYRIIPPAIWALMCALGRLGHIRYYHYYY